MDKTQLQKIFYDPTTGFIGLMQLYTKSKELGLGLSYKDVKKWYDEQPVNQIYSNPRKVKLFNPIRPILPQVGTFQMDLMDFSRFKFHNKGYTFLLNIIDVHSRYAWSFPLKKKTPNEIEPHLESILKLVKGPISFTFDKGTEFKGKVSKLLKSYNASVNLNDPHAINAHHTVGMIERFNRTLLGRIKKYMNHNETLTYVDVLDQLVSNYNNTVHSSIKKKPYDVMYRNAIPIVDIDVVNDTKFKIGDNVRFLRVRKLFDKKAFMPVYSLDVHKIIDRKGHKFKLDNGNYYYEEQLIHGTEDSSNNFDKIHTTNAKNERTKRLIRQDFGMPVDDVSKQIIDTKRVRKQPDRYF